ncbi:MAG: type II secretion system F family protein [Rickettsiales bacterium]|jgi:type IV pilus assembly protein PilC|nr:type II secretion system F family protein [Rickettsiales bacterium]
MANYSYIAVSEQGKQFKGSMNASGLSDLQYKLSDIGLELITASESSSSFFNFTKTISVKDLILICTHFEQLDKAGVPIIESIEDLIDSASGNVMRNLVQDIYDDVKSGKMLSQAMSNHPKTFDEVFIGLIAAGEKTGKLHQSFAYLSDHLKWADDIKRKTKKAVKYPIFLLVVLFAVTAIMMLFVIPKLSDFLLNQNFDLPFYTKALIASSEFFKQNWALMIIIPGVTVFLHKLLKFFVESYAYYTDKLILNIPFIGKALLKIDIARFTQFFLITYKSGIDIIACLQVVEKVVKNRVVKRTLAEITQEISDGSTMSLALKKSNQFPSLVVRMFRVGEQTGNMTESLENIKFFYDKEVNDAVDSLIGLIQPVLTLVMGGLLLWISLSVFGPLYSSFSTIK